MTRAFTSTMIAGVVAAISGCGGNTLDLGALISSKGAEAPTATLKRVPCRIELGPLGAALEVDLSELKNIALDASEIYNQIVAGKPSEEPPSRGLPVLTVINKRNNNFTHFTLAQNVDEIRLRTGKSESVQLLIKNKDPLEIELWVDTEDDIDLDVEFSDPLGNDDPE